MRPAFLDRHFDPQTHWPRHRGVWLVLGAIVAAQLMALWMLCSQQVRKAETRNARLQVQQMALADCLRYVPGATAASCTGQLPSATPPTPNDGPVATVVTYRATPVSYTIR
jgi:hypothetical protein